MLACELFDSIEGSDVETWCDTERENLVTFARAHEPVLLAVAF
jgi:hypothetical protein